MLSTRWKLRLGALAVLVVSAPTVVRVVAAGELQEMRATGGPDDATMLGAFVLCACYLGWSFLLGRLEKY